MQSTAGIQRLPQDRESLFISICARSCPKSSKPNTLQLAPRTRIKLFFYRPAAPCSVLDYSTPFQEQLTLTRVG